MGASKYLYKILVAIKITVACFICAALIANLYLIVSQHADKTKLPKIFGFSQIIVISGSMQPDIKAGDLIIIQEQAMYREKDIITYHEDEALITHRIIGIDQTGVITRGDANNANDAPVVLSDIEGKVVLCIPGGGNFILFLRKPLGILTIICIAFVLYILKSVLEKLKREKKKVK